MERKSLGANQVHFFDHDDDEEERDLYSRSKGSGKLEMKILNFLTTSLILLFT